MEFLFEYGLFLAKAATFAAVVIVVAAALASFSLRQGSAGKPRLEVTRLNDRYRQMRQSLQAATLTGGALKKERKAWKREQKRREKTTGERKRIFVLNFVGDIRGSHVASLREEVTAVLTAAKPGDEVLVKVESAGGVVHAYGLAASQLDRVRARDIPLTVCVDKVAASGGYLMACVANRLVAAPFSIIGSIGVIAQLPNFNKLLKKHDIEYEQITAGEFKRTLTVFGENTDRQREKMKQDIELTHGLFKDFVSRHRPGLDIDKVSTGEYWMGSRAHELGLVDELGTSDDMLLEACDDCELLEIAYRPRQTVIRRLATAASAAVSRLASRWAADRSGVTL